MMKMNRRVFGLFLVSLAAATLTPGAQPSRGQGSNEVVIIINARNPTSGLSSSQVQKLFMGTTGFWHGVVPVKVFVRPSAGDPAKAFFGKVLKKSAQAYAKHWDKLQLSGRAVAPKAIGGAADLSAAIAKTPGGIGFALASEAWSVSGVKVIPIR